MSWRNRAVPFAVALTVVLLFIMLFPFFVMLSTMIKTSEEVYTIPPHWIPLHPTFRNFPVAWFQYSLFSYFKSSIIIAVATTALNILVSVPAGYAIGRLRFVGKKLALYVVLVSQMFSPVVVVISLFKTFGALHLLNTYISLILTNTVFSISFSIWLMSGYFRTIPIEIEEAASIDGASRIRTVLSVLMPIAAPGFVTTMINTFIYAWNDYFFALSFINTQSKMPITLGLYNFVGRWSTQWHLLSASAFLAIIPVLILFYVIQRRLVSGLASGAVKG